MYHLQGKTERVTPAALLALLADLYRDKLRLRQRHVAAARLVSHYEFNNTYQYVIAREDTHLEWLRAAVADLGGTPEEVAEPEVRAPGRGRQALEALLRDEVAQADAFIETWRARIPAITHARHGKMCQVVLGETLEHRRLFAQALEGREDLLGRRTGGLTTGGGVLPTRWVE